MVREVRHAGGVQIRELGRGQVGSMWMANGWGGGGGGASVNCKVLRHHRSLKQMLRRAAGVQIRELGRGQFGSIWMAKWLGWGGERGGGLLSTARS